MPAPAVDLAAARAALTAERGRLLDELGEPIENPGQMTYGSQAASASQVFEQQRDLALREHSRAELARVDAALRALDNGTYGACVSCGNPIAPERLEAIPWAPTCIDCARKAGR
ncbi:MAG TPA: TraR/DksA C4-type zinc finger protein [Candidatus Eisenbacteria bacterium]|nr:TraR/DksA C4-type zinc finger protein [Candidatus Eisenbacteria bacterium]